MEYRRIPLTKLQAEIAAWALDPMDDFFDENIADGSAVGEKPDMPVMDGTTLVMPMHYDVIDDFLYRVEGQLVEMTERADGWGETPQKRAGTIRMCFTLGDKVRAACAGYDRLPTMFVLDEGEEPLPRDWWRPEVSAND